MKPQYEETIDEQISDSVALDFPWTTRGQSQLLQRDTWQANQNDLEDIQYTRPEMIFFPLPSLQLVVWMMEETFWTFCRRGILTEWMEWMGVDGGRR